MNQIPEMDDPLGKHWNQPKDIRYAPMDDTHVILSPRQVAILHEYSASIPTGVYPGKCWKRIQKDIMILAWFGTEVDGQCTINWREVLIL